MLKCRGSSSQKLDKAESPGDGEVLSVELIAKFRSAVSMLRYLSTEHSDITGTMRVLRSVLALSRQKEGPVRSGHEAHSDGVQAPGLV